MMLELSLESLSVDCEMKRNQCSEESKGYHNEFSREHTKGIKIDVKGKERLIMREV